MSDESQRLEPHITVDYLWGLLSPVEQLKAIGQFWRSDEPDDRDTQALLIGVLARCRNFREKYVRERSVEWKAEQLLKQINNKPFDAFVIKFLQCFHSEVSEKVSDATGLVDEGDKLSANEPVDPEEVVASIAEMKICHSPRDLLVFYGFPIALATAEQAEAWNSVATSSVFQELMAACRIAPEPAAIIPEPIPEMLSTPVQPEQSDEFTTVDNLMIKTAVAAAIGEGGALERDQLDDLIQEIITLDTTRLRSYFHLGYADALLGRPMREDFAGWNTARRGWCFTGFLMGQLRSARANTIAELVKRHRKLWDELLEDGPRAPRAMLAPHLTSRLGEVGEWGLVRQLMNAIELPSQPNQAVHLCAVVYRLCASLVRGGDSSNAIPLLNLLLDRVRRNQALDLDSSSFYEAACLRKLGQAHLRAGQMAEAKDFLGECLTAADFQEAANAQADLGLAQAGFRSLEFILPKDDEAANEGILRALEASKSLFERALSCAGEPTNANFILGLIAFYRRDGAKAEQFLTEALAGMLEKEQAYQAILLIDWVRFILAMLIAEQCEQARLNEVRNLVDTAVRSAPSFPLHLWKRLCEATALYNDKSVAESIVTHLLEKRGDDAYHLLHGSELLISNPSLRRKYREWIVSRSVAPSERGEALIPLLHQALRARDNDEAAEVFDSLERIATESMGFVPRFLDYLRQLHEPLLAIVDEVDLDHLEAELLARAGEIDQAAVVLERIFYRARSEEDWTSVGEIFAQLEDLRPSHVDLDDLRLRAKPAQPAVEDASASLDNIRVLYVGGNETQMRYEKEIRRRLETGYPGLGITFFFPGWSSNWHVHLDRIKPRLPLYDVVVINRLVRTQFGRNLRAACGAETPWRACSGRGRESLLRSIENSARWAGMRRERDRG